ncbi:beta strand repeat-containing protein [Frigoribacterium sp. 2-23]|uniref:beta strand repeat-containing protein n=1 Tax=Frigoribacterium sp. 2-23 TaxID=3415006 RepID=UPI003C6FA000
MSPKHRSRPHRRLGFLSGATITALVAAGAVVLAPQAASAADKFSADLLYATQSGTNATQIVSVDPATGNANTVLTTPANAGTVNQIGISNDGERLITASSSTVYNYSATPGTWTAVRRPATPTVSGNMGGIDPKTGLYFFGGNASDTTFTFMSYDPSSTTINASTLFTATVTGAPGTNGDLAFDRQGNMYFISSTAANVTPRKAQLYRVDAANLKGGTTSAATPVGPEIVPSSALNSLAFGPDGYLYISGATADTFIKANPVTGERVSSGSITLNGTIVPVNDLASRAVPTTGQAQAGFSNGRKDADDQLTVTIGGGDVKTPAKATTGTKGEPATAGPVILLPGQSYTATQSAGNTTTNVNDYDTSYVCTNLVDGKKVSEGKGSTASFMVPASGGDISCVFSNPLKPSVDDTKSTGNRPGQPVTVDVLKNAQGDIDPTTVQLATNGVAGSTVSSDGRTLTVPGEGTWTVNPTTGALTFTPEAGFTRNPTPARYSVADTRGNRAQSTAAVTYLGVAQDDTGTTTQGTATTVDVLANDTGSLVPGSVVFPAAGQPAGAAVSNGGKTLTVPGQGVYTIDPTTGAVTFTPAPAFRGTATPVTYQVADADGATSTATLTVTVTPVGPKVADDVASTQQNTPVTVDVTANDAPGVAGGTPIDKTTVVFPADGQPAGAAVSNGGRTLTVPGQGTYTVSPTTGQVTFTPERAYTGTPTPITYRVSDTGGESATGRLELTVGAVTPTARPDTATTTQGASTTVPVLANDTAGNKTTPIDETTVVFPASGQPTGAVVSDGGRTLTVSGQGVYTVDRTTGEITFAPEPLFRSAASAVTYRVSDVDKQTTSSTLTVTVTPVGPIAVDDSGRTGQNTPVRIAVAGNDEPGVKGGTPIEPTSVRFPTVGQTSGAVVSDGGTTLTVDREGVYRVDTATGVVTFTPAQGYAGTTTAIVYQVADTGGETDTASLSVVVDAVRPTAVADTASTTQGASTTVDVLADDLPGNAATPLDPESVLFPATGQPDGAVVSDGDRTLTVPGEGVYTIDPKTGEITFAPLPAFRGDATPVTYQVADVDGTTAEATLTVSVTPVAPKPGDDDATTEQNTPVTVDVTVNDAPGVAGGTPVDKTTVVFPAAGQPAGSTVTDGGRTLTVPGEGVYTADPVTGAVTFAPAQGFASTTTPVVYQVSDTDGQSGTGRLVVTVTAVSPTARPDTATTTQGASTTVDVLVNDSAGNAATPLRRNSVVFPTSGQPADAVVSDRGMTLTVPGEGVNTIDPKTGDVTYAPDPAFRGDTTPVTYQVGDVDDQTTSSTVTVSVTPVAPGAADDTARTGQNTPVTVDVAANDKAGVVGGTPVDPTTVRFPNTVQADGVVVSDKGTTATVKGEGVYRVDPATGAVTFTPARGFTGKTTPVVYQVADQGGEVSTAAVTVTVDAVAPTAKPDTAVTPQNTPVTVAVTGNDTPGNAGTPIDAAATRLLDANGNAVTSLEVVGKGTFAVDAATGAITFTPTVGFTGPVTASYRVVDIDGGASTSTISVTVGAAPVAKNDARTGEAGKPVTVDVLGNDGPGSSAVDPASVRLVDPATGALVPTLTLPGKGTFTVGADGSITFTPVAGFAGTVTVTYSVAGVDGSRSTATLSITIPEGARLAFTGSEFVGAGVGAALFLIVAGLALVVVRRRRMGTEQ